MTALALAPTGTRCDGCGLTCSHLRLTLADLIAVIFPGAIRDHRRMCPDCWAAEGIGQ